MPYSGYRLYQAARRDRELRVARDRRGRLAAARARCRGSVGRRLRAVLAAAVRPLARGPVPGPAGPGPAGR
jgi:hypothetical protein